MTDPNCHVENPKEWKYLKGCNCMYCYDHEEISMPSGGLGLGRNPVND